MMASNPGLPSDGQPSRPTVRPAGHRLQRPGRLGRPGLGSVEPSGSPRDRGSTTSRPRNSALTASCSRRCRAPTVRRRPTHRVVCSTAPSSQPERPICVVVYRQPAATAGRAGRQYEQRQAERRRHATPSRRSATTTRCRTSQARLAGRSEDSQASHDHPATAGPGATPSHARR